MPSEFGIILADTSRSRAYLVAMVSNNVLPTWILVLDSACSDQMSAQVLPDATKRPQDLTWPEANFDPTEPLASLLQRLGLTYELSGSREINDPRVVELIRRSDPQVLVYSGYGGALLRDEVLSTGKNFLHIHGGYLPDYKGSTTTYYSILTDGSIGASALFLTKEIDCGPVLRRRRFPPPVDRNALDHIYDSAARARILVETLKDWKRTGEWNFELPDNAGGFTYYIIHPVLKHLAILARGGAKNE